MGNIKFKSIGRYGIHKELSLLSIKKLCVILDKLCECLKTNSLKFDDIIEHNDEFISMVKVLKLYNEFYLNDLRYKCKELDISYFDTLMEFNEFFKNDISKDLVGSLLNNKFI